MLVNNINKVW